MMQESKKVLMPTQEKHILGRGRDRVEMMKKRKL
jgi:hypothetical protein